ncbi:toxin-antitoxin system HicB family antitoxin [Streptomyces flavofungini]|uniref:toxin-antitoxin system HicB family antitoxin n=1 Tax=Streptomyces flavofungini TaxID=68200 RepID=UPI0025AEF420|nr:toxin-antitoxin system HicB family antitoxin [Streptomyces flavofungini]WJV45023.1 toxin-antitoxin system HicB family antitoxin [Streptomyces flavofungini]
MDLTPYVDSLRRELSVAADADGDEARATAERLTAQLESATRLTLLRALSDAAGEITGELAPGSVDVRLRGREPEFVVTPAPLDDWSDRAAPEPAPAGPAPVPPPALSAEDLRTTVRINLRLPSGLKLRAEKAAAREGLSLNAWLVRAISTALEPEERTVAPEAGPQGFADRGGRSHTGWVG